jgi:hypothetical protein
MVLFKSLNYSCLPAGFDDARHFTGERQLAEADAAQVEFAQVAARAAATEAAVAMAASELGRLFVFRDFGGSGHE